jgi:hypothetical protein
MSQQDIVIAVLRRTAIHELRVAEETLTSPYLDQVRPTRKIIEDLIAAREIELAKAMAAAQRKRIEEDLAFLRDELARSDGSFHRGLVRDERP